MTTKPDWKVDDELQEEISRLKTGVDANKEWARVTSRIADALEHLTLPGTVGMIMAMGRKPPDAKIEGHLKDCPNCTMLRDSTAMTILPPNGNLGS